jgi:hypothetical protein
MNFIRLGILEKYRSSGRPHGVSCFCFGGLGGVAVWGGAEGRQEAVGEEKPLRLRQCKRYLERTLAAEFRGIVQGFVKEARKGGCAHMKLTAELLEEAAGPVRRGKGSIQKLLEKVGE